MTRHRILSLFIFFPIIFFTQTKKIDSLKNVFKSTIEDTSKLKLLIDIGKEFYSIHPDSALSNWFKAKEFAENRVKKHSQFNPEKISLLINLGKSLNNLGFVYFNKSDFKNGLLYYGKSLKIFQGINYKSGIAISLQGLGMIYSVQGDIQKAKQYYLNSLKITEQIGDDKGYVKTINNLGFLYKNTGEIIQALDCFNRSLKKSEKIGDKQGIALATGNIGIIHHTQGEFNKAIEYFNRSLNILQEIGDKKATGAVMNNIGFVYKDQKNYIKSLEFYQRSLKIKEDIGDRQGVATTLNNIGDIYCDAEYLASKNSNQDTIKALLLISLDYYGRSLIIQREVGNKIGIAAALCNIGKVYFKQKKYSDAFDNLNKSLILAKELGNPEMIREDAESLSQVHRALGNYQLALENYELYIRMRDSVNNIETQKAAIQHDAKYEYEKQQAIAQASFDKQQAITKIELNKQRLFIYSLIAGVLLVSLVLLQSIRAYKQKKRDNIIIQEQKSEVEKQRQSLMEKNGIIEEKQKEILDSINYAKRIQYTLLAHEDFLKNNLNDYFIYFNPKDIVYGDFYWATNRKGKFYLAVCDCTGHGVPGAFMSLLSIGLLNEAINEKEIEKPNEVFDYVRKKLSATISREGQKDGFDGILVCKDVAGQSITYAAANNAPVMVQKGLLSELPADRMPVGIGERKDNFTLFSVEAKVGSMLYLYTDGYADQFGGPRGKKFMYKQLNSVLLNNFEKSLNEQKEDLKNIFHFWKGSLEQVDDVSIVGFRL